MSSSLKQLAALPLALLLLAATPRLSTAQPAREYSYSLAQAKRQGTFVTEIEMVPGVLKWKGHTITLKEAWIEKCKTGGCYLCFRLKEGSDAFCCSNETAKLVLEDGGASVLMHLGRGWTSASQHLESEDFAKARFSLIGGWREERPKNIHFVRKK